jgi:hypothetical protein
VNFAVRKLALILGIDNKLTDGSLSIFCAVELDHSSSLGSSVGLILNLCTFDLADSGEQFDEVFVAGGPWKLNNVSWSAGR